MMDLIGINWIIERINWLIKRFAEREDANIKQRNDAINALLDALSETRIMFGTCRVKGQRDRIKEEMISRLWTKASRAVEPFDQKLANRCLTKGKYWSDPTGWNTNDLLAAKITIEEVEQSLQELKTKGP